MANIPAEPQGDLLDGDKVYTVYTAMIVLEVLTSTSVIVLLSLFSSFSNLKEHCIKV